MSWCSRLCYPFPVELGQKSFKVLVPSFCSPSSSLRFHHSLRRLCSSAISRELMGQNRILPQCMQPVSNLQLQQLFMEVIEGSLFPILVTLWVEV